MAHGSWLMAHGSWLMAHGSWQTYPLRGEVLHAASHAVREHSQVPGCERVGVLGEVVVVLPRPVVTQEGQQLPVHHVFHDEQEGFWKERQGTIGDDYLKSSPGVETLLLISL